MGVVMGGPVVVLGSYVWGEVVRMSGGWIEMPNWVLLNLKTRRVLLPVDGVEELCMSRVHRESDQKYDWDTIPSVAPSLGEGMMRAMSYRDRPLRRVLPNTIAKACARCASDEWKDGLGASDEWLRMRSERLYRRDVVVVGLRLWVGQEGGDHVYVLEGSPEDGGRQVMSTVLSLFRQDSLKRWVSPDGFWDTVSSGVCG